MNLTHRRCTNNDPHHGCNIVWERMFKPRSVGATDASSESPDCPVLPVNEMDGLNLAGPSTSNSHIHNQEYLNEETTNGSEMSQLKLSAPAEASLALANCRSSKQPGDNESPSKEGRKRKNQNGASKSECDSKRLKDNP